MEAREEGREEGSSCRRYWDGIEFKYLLSVMRIKIVVDLTPINGKFVIITKGKE